MVGPVAQWSVQETHNFLVLGSNPSGPINPLQEVSMILVILCSIVFACMVKYEVYRYFIGATLGLILAIVVGFFLPTTPVVVKEIELDTSLVNRMYRGHSPTIEFTIVNSDGTLSQDYEYVYGDLLVN